jgi:inhibitor of cysteine peptidase
MRVDESYNNQIVTLGRGQLLEIVLASNPSTGYQWQFGQPVDYRVLRQIDYRYVPAGAPWLVGGGGMEYWLYRAMDPGTTTILMYYTRPWENQRPTKVFRLRVNVR